MADNSRKVVYAALIGNVLVAASKFGAAALSGSSALLTEAIHSSADTMNQLLLLIGDKRSRARPDKTHEFGYGMEIYFWTFVVAVIVLLAGGAASIYEGVQHLRAPEPIKSPLISIGVLVLAAVFEGSSLAVGYREYKRQIRTHGHGKTVSLWRFIVWSKDPNLYESLLEDSAALIGIAIALAGVLASIYLHAEWADGAASVAIGVLLILDSYVIAAATRSLIAGEAVAPPLREDLDRKLDELRDGIDATQMRTLQLGPRSILIALTIARDPKKTARQLEADLAGLTEGLKSIDGRITQVVFEFDGTAAQIEGERMSTSEGGT